MTALSFIRCKISVEHRPSSEVMREQAVSFIVSLWIHLDHEPTHVCLEVCSIFGAANDVLPQKRPVMDSAILESAPNIAKHTL